MLPTHGLQQDVDPVTKMNDPGVQICGKGLHSPPRGGRVFLLATFESSSPANGLNRDILRPRIVI